MLSPIHHHRRSLAVVLRYSLLCIIFIARCASGGADIWPLDRPDGMPAIQNLEVMCGKDHMDVHLTFSQPFEGIVSSKGQHGDPRCVYVPPSTGQTFFSFRIAYARCGTKPDLHGQFYENTVVVQYDKDLLEVWDEAKRLRCEWFNDYEKTASKPPMVIADLDVIQLDFRGDNVDCWMEIQHGKGPWAPPVSGIVPLGSTLTLVVAINDYRGEFDMRVKSCAASDGAGHVIQLSDEFGCVLRPKMISRFLKARGADDRASVITYAFFHAFKFPDALSVHIKCKVEICRHGCLDHCQHQLEREDGDPELTSHYADAVDRKDEHAASEERVPSPSEQVHETLISDASYDDIVHEESNGVSVDNFPSLKMPLKAPSGSSRPQQPQQSQFDDDKQTDERPAMDEDPELDITAMPHKDLFLNNEKFPHGPRTFTSESEIPLAAPRSFSEDTIEGSYVKPTDKAEKLSDNSTSSTKADAPSPPAHATSERLKRRRRSVVVSDRKARSADVGVSGLYEVISEADLAFSPDSRAEAVTVFQGRIREEVVYGICMPVPGFSMLFVLVAASAVVSALVAGTLLYRYQLQKEQLAEQAQQPVPLSLFTNWVGARFMRMRNCNATHAQTDNGAIDSGAGSSGSATSNGKSEDARHID